MWCDMLVILATCWQPCLILYYFWGGAVLMLWMEVYEFWGSTYMPTLPTWHKLKHVFSVVVGHILHLLYAFWSQSSASGATLHFIINIKLMTFSSYMWSSILGLAKVKNSILQLYLLPYYCLVLYIFYDWMKIYKDYYCFTSLFPLALFIYIYGKKKCLQHCRRDPTS